MGSLSVYSCLLKKDLLLYIPRDFSCSISTNEERKGQVPPDEWLRLRATETSAELMMKEDKSAHSSSPKDALLSAVYCYPHRIDCLQLSATNFQVETKQALGEDGYCLTLISDILYNSAHQKLQVGKRNEQLVEEGMLCKPALP